MKMSKNKWLDNQIAVQAYRILLRFALLYFPNIAVLKKNFMYLFIIIINFFLAASSLCSCVQAFSSCSERELLFIAARGLVIVVVSLVAGHRL